MPVVAKADTMTIQERMTHLKQTNDFLNEKSTQTFDFKEEGIDSSWLSEHATFNRIGAVLEAEGGNKPIKNLNNYSYTIQRFLYSCKTEKVNNNWQTEFNRIEIEFSVSFFCHPSASSTVILTPMTRTSSDLLH